MKSGISFKQLKQRYSGHSLKMLDTYSIPNEAKDLLLQGIIKNAKQKGLPKDILSHAQKVQFKGSRLPSIAINWRFAESMAALKGFEAAMLGVLLSRRYELAEPLKAVINTWAPSST